MKLWQEIKNMLEQFVIRLAFLILWSSFLIVLFYIFLFLYMYWR